MATEVFSAVTRFTPPVLQFAIGFTCGTSSAKRSNSAEMAITGGLRFLLVSVWSPRTIMALKSAPIHKGLAAQFPEVLSRECAHRAASVTLGATKGGKH